MVTRTSKRSSLIRHSREKFQNFKQMSPYCTALMLRSRISLKVIQSTSPVYFRSPRPESSFTSFMLSKPRGCRYQPPLRALAPKSSLNCCRRILSILGSSADRYIGQRWIIHQKIHFEFYGEAWNQLGVLS